MTEIPTSEVLNRAADLIEERGWGRGPYSMYGESGVCAMGALHLATFGHLPERGAGQPNYHRAALCPAGRALHDYIGERPGVWPGIDRIWTWNDNQEDSRSVVEAIRACAVIEASHEREAAEVSA